MSEEMTNRQKIVRVAASAAICGLSISFLLGELVDERAQFLLASAEDAKILPREYSPIRPLSAAMNIAHSAGWKEVLVANNSLHLDPPSLISDEIKVAQSAPQKMTKVVKQEISSKRIQKNKTSAGEVERVLLSIHSATASLREAQKVKKDITAVAEEEGKNTFWTIRGKISGAPIERGHFEVGIFSQIDAEGVPMGFPLVQQILPAGSIEFNLKVSPKVSSGYLFGEFVSTKKGKRTWIAPPVNPVSKGDAQFAELVFKQEDKINTIAAATTQTNNESRVYGQVSTMFVVSGKPIPQADVIVKIRGRKEATRTDVGGNYSLDLSNIRGTVFIEFLKAGYHPVILPVQLPKTTKIPTIELASKDAIDSLASRLGIRQISTKGVFMGRAQASDGSALKGLSLQLSLKADGPYYFSEEGIPSSEKKSTSAADGRVIFFNVEPGVGFVEATINGESVAPFPISLVEGGELSFHNLNPVTLRLNGRLFNPVSPGGGLLPLSSAKIRVDGSSEWTATDSFGAFSVGPGKFIQNENILLEASADRFNNHRYLISWEQLERAEKLSLFAFPAEYFGKLAASMDLPIDAYAGVVVGKMPVGEGLRVDALSDHSTVNSAKDFYFDQKGKVRGSHNMTDPKFGTFVIFNVPRGKTLLQGNDSGGKLRHSQSVFSGPSSVSVMIDN